MTMTSAVPAIENPTTSTFKRGLAWAGLAGIGGCAAMCSLPMLAAGLFGGGAIATAVARVATPGAELVVGGTAFALVLGGMGLRALAGRRRARERASTTLAGTTEIPIACDPLVFSKDERTAHHDLARNVIARWPSKREELADGYQFHYQGNEDVFLAIARWVASEHRCCSWASFSLEMEPFTTEAPGTIRLQMRGPGEAKKLLSEAFTLLEGDARADLFLNPTGKITPQIFSNAKATASRGCGC